MPPPAHTPVAGPPRPPPPPSLPAELLDLLSSIARRGRDLESHQIPELAACNGPLSLHEEMAASVRGEVGGMRRDLEELKLQVDDLDRDRDRKAGAERVAQVVVGIDRILKSYKDAVITSKKRIDANAIMTPRDELLRRRPNAKGATTASTTPANADDALMSATSDVTEGLRRTMQLMQSELDRSLVSNEILEQSTATMQMTSDQYSTFSTLLTTSKNLITSMERADFLDRLILLFAFIFFCLVCAWVFKRRVVDKGIRVAGALGRVVARGGSGTTEELKSELFESVAQVVVAATTTVSSVLAAATSSIARAAPPPLPSPPTQSVVPVVPEAVKRVAEAAYSNVAEPIQRIVAEPITPPVWGGHEEAYDDDDEEEDDEEFFEAEEEALPIAPVGIVERAKEIFDHSVEFVEQGMDAVEHGFEVVRDAVEDLMHTPVDDEVVEEDPIPESIVIEEPLHIDEIEPPALLEAQVEPEVEVVMDSAGAIFAPKPVRPATPYDHAEEAIEANKVPTPEDSFPDYSEDPAPIYVEAYVEEVTPTYIEEATPAYTPSPPVSVAVPTTSPPAAAAHLDETPELEDNSEEHIFDSHQILRPAGEYPSDAQDLIDEHAVEMEPVAEEEHGEVEPEESEFVHPTETEDYEEAPAAVEEAVFAPSSSYRPTEPGYNQVSNDHHAEEEGELAEIIPIAEETDDLPPFDDAPLEAGSLTETILPEVDAQPPLAQPEPTVPSPLVEPTPPAEVEDTLDDHSFVPPILRPAGTPLDGLLVDENSFDEDMISEPIAEDLVVEEPLVDLPAEDLAADEAEEEDMQVDLSDEEVAEREPAEDEDEDDRIFVPPVLRPADTPLDESLIEENSVKTESLTDKADGTDEEILAEDPSHVEPPTPEPVFDVQPSVTEPEPPIATATPEPIVDTEAVIPPTFDSEPELTPEKRQEQMRTIQEIIDDGPWKDILIAQRAEMEREAAAARGEASEREEEEEDDTLHVRDEL